MPLGPCLVLCPSWISDALRMLRNIQAVSDVTFTCAPILRVGESRNPVVIPILFYLYMLHCFRVGKLQSVLKCSEWLSSRRKFINCILAAPAIKVSSNVFFRLNIFRI